MNKYDASCKISKNVKTEIIWLIRQHLLILLKTERRHFQISKQQQ